MRIGLVTGSAPFAGLPDNPATDLLGRIDGAVIGGVTIRTAQIPVSRARLPEVIAGLIEEHRPDFYVSLGLATGAPVLRLETTAINRVDFGVAHQHHRELLVADPEFGFKRVERLLERLTGGVAPGFAEDFGHL